MAYIKFTDKETPIIGSITVISDKIIRVKTDESPNTSGFALYLDAFMTKPMSNDEYTDYTTLYNQGEGWFELSKDGTVYEEINPVIEFPEIDHPGFEEYVPTLEELKTSKIAELRAIKDSVIAQGFTVALTDGEIEHFDLEGDAKLYLTALKTEVMNGTDPIPWHNSDPSIACKYYSNNDMNLITQTALSTVVYHETYINDIVRYATLVETEEELEAIQYGMVLPEEYQSEPLKAMLAQLNA